MSDVTIEAFERHVAATRSTRTAQTYARGATKLMDFVGETQSSDPSTWPQTILDDWVAWMVGQKLASRTIKLMVVGGRLYLKFWRKRNPSVPELDMPAIPKVRGKPPVVLGAQALRNYLTLVDEEEVEPFRTMMVLLPLCGLRSEELVSMRLGDITVQPDPDVASRSWVIFDVRGKGDKNRIVPLLQEANIHIRHYLGGWRAERRQSEDWLFPGSVMGRHVTTRALREHVSAFRRRHGVKELSPHSLRSTWCTLLDRHGVSSLTLAQLAGHMRPEGKTELQTLARHYVHHAVPDLMRALADVRV
jgi:site-specific recombinase XerD